MISPKGLKFGVIFGYRNRGKRLVLDSELQGIGVKTYEK